MVPALVRRPGLSESFSDITPILPEPWEFKWPDDGFPETDIRYRQQGNWKASTFWTLSTGSRRETGNDVSIAPGPLPPWPKL